ncbi:hypothetical protein AB5N19_12981 [Seiridium cardinale]|uniref:Uncharacterized protein n=1 Tax=Seiridium cardinale TaxID=138064 RepID=A0ABR2XRR3_9PEZI
MHDGVPASILDRQILTSLAYARNNVSQLSTTTSIVNHRSCGAGAAPRSRPCGKTLTDARQRCWPSTVDEKLTLSAPGVTVHQLGDFADLVALERGLDDAIWTPRQAGQATKVAAVPSHQTMAAATVLTGANLQQPGTSSPHPSLAMYIPHLLGTPSLSAMTD